jgi:hypothetical protein
LSGGNPRNKDTRESHDYLQQGSPGHISSYECD